MITWRKSIPNVDVINCYIGTWLVASIKFYSGDSHFGIETNLPGLNRFQGSHHDLELAKDKVEDVIIEWLDKAGLTFKKDVTP